MKILILGGTAEAAELAESLVAAGHAVTTSLAGRTASPRPLAGQVRVGGFGGAAGLEAHLRAEGYQRVIDATHPFAARIAAHAEAACGAASVPRVKLLRPMWEHRPEDTWIEVHSMDMAAALLPSLGRRAFLTIGVNEVAVFAGCGDVFFLVRLLAPAPLPLPDHALIIGRPPFEAADEEVLMRAHGIDVVVTKAAGGAATEGKIAAARALRLPVLMIRRPTPPPGPLAASVEAVLAWITSSDATSPDATSGYGPERRDGIR
ncbi:cobalt-precorrin-6A reductase [Magnetospirillum sp. UT-4]|uniref:cobalt-precorrin-6A reductase n=1 Tax=Magnetospirillum sp. UT-4 TaxID=2681467 RepID=UPI00137DACE8|nr:cobalt-precorrin-6A reductase [Magnetospirillum sp. UT-4]CAA7617261.1 Precorrin-6A reductase [Magnetospirillum sp. UT-4]